MTPLFERYRPATWADVVGQGDAVAGLQAVAEVAGGYGGQAWYLIGGTGTGKTSIARLIAAELAEPWSVEEVDAQDVNPAYIRHAQKSAVMYGLGPRNGRVWIVNEAHRLSETAVSRFLTAFEPIPDHCAWIFTTTHAAQALLFDGKLDADPFLSRCNVVKLAQRDICQAYAGRVWDIMQREGLAAWSSLADCVECVKQSRNNLRESIQTMGAKAAKARALRKAVAA